MQCVLEAIEVTESQGENDAINMEVNEGLEGGDDAANRYLTDTAGQPSSL